jgi:anti-anti-sigma factor
MNDAITEIRVHSTGGTAVIEAPASFDTGTAPRVRELAIALQRDGVTGIVFDLGAVVFLDNQALAVIEGTRCRLRRAGGRIAVAAAAARSPACSTSPR